MKKKIILYPLMIVTIFVLVINSTKAQNVPQLGKASIKQVIAAMTLEEKVNLVVGTGMRMPGAPQQQSPGQGFGHTSVLVDGSAGTTFGIPRLGINPSVVADGPAGLRISPTRQDDNNTYYCTAFPVATLLASTWNTELVSEVGKAMGNEVLEYGVDVILGPGMNIQRNPLCGRNFEYYSEDPYITGKMAAAMVNGIESNGVGTSIKHYAGNNAETNRNELNVIVSERALREIYLEGFRIAVEESQPWTVMSSYNKINGTYASQNYDLLTNVLRKDWGFKGYVMTDWFGGKDAVEQMKAGNDLLMPGTPNQSKALIQAVKDGKLDVKVIDQNVERILTVIMMGPRFKGYKYSNKPDLKAHANVTRQAATEGMVLLKNNDQALPLPAQTRNLAVFGNTSYDIITGGTGSGDVNEAYSVSLVDGLQNAGYSVNSNLKAMYDAFLAANLEGRPKREGMAMFMLPEPIPEFSINEGLANSMAVISDAAIITIGRNSGEGRDRFNEKGDFRLSDNEQTMIKTISAAFKAKNKKTIVILNVGGVIETASWKDNPDAILLAWQAGQETGNSIADILSGKINPSGKIAVTFPASYEDVPSSKTFPGKELQKSDQNTRGGFFRAVPAEDTYTEGIYIGYRYYETFGVKPSYEFGYGLSYSTYEYNNLRLSSAKFGKTMTVTVDVTNTGKYAGKEIVELYLTAPKGSLDKPAIELKGFAKTRELKPGETQTVTLVLTDRSLASFDPATSTWFADAGKYTVKIGASSQDIRQQADFTVAKKLLVKKETKALVPVAVIEEIMKK